jgi:hypothetical protein
VNLPEYSMPAEMVHGLSHHLITVPVAACACCGREYPRDMSAPTNLFCAGCRQAHHADAEALIRKLRDHILSIESTRATEFEILRARIVELEGFINKVMDRFYGYMREEGISLLGLLAQGNLNEDGSSSDESKGDLNEG